MSTVAVYMNDKNEVYVRQNANASQLNVEYTMYQAETSEHFIFKNAVLSAFIKSANVRIVETIEAKNFDDAELIKQKKIEEYASKSFLIVNQRETALTSSFYREMLSIEARVAKFKSVTKTDERSAEVIFTDKKLREKFKIDYLMHKNEYKQILADARKYLSVNETELRLFNVA